jgi:hypothetical protein
MIAWWLRSSALGLFLALATGFVVPPALGQDVPVRGEVDDFTTREEVNAASQTTPRPAAAVPAAPAIGSPSNTTRVAIDRPGVGAPVPARVTVVGWAADSESTGSGVDAVYLYLDGEAGQGHFLGAATYGAERADVAAELGHPRFALSGYSLEVELPPGAHTLYAYARRRGSAEPGLWSAPASVDLTVMPDSTGPTTSRILNLPPGSCARAPDGACLNRMPGPAPTCPQITADGQCNTAATGALPGLVGQQPGASPASSGAASASFSLRVEQSGNMAVFNWGPVPGAATYELQRCNAATAQSCSSVVVLSATTYQLPRGTNNWYRVEARATAGHVVSVSNTVGPT